LHQNKFGVLEEGLIKATGGFQLRLSWSMTHPFFLAAPLSGILRD